MSYNVQRSHFKSFTFPCSKLFLNFLAGPDGCELLSFFESSGNLVFHVLDNKNELLIEHASHISGPQVATMLQRKWHEISMKTAAQASLLHSQCACSKSVSLSIPQAAVIQFYRNQIVREHNIVDLLVDPSGIISWFGPEDNVIRVTRYIVKLLKEHFPKENACPAPEKYSDDTPYNQDNSSTNFNDTISENCGFTDMCGIPPGFSPLSSMPPQQLFNVTQEQMLRNLIGSLPAFSYLNQNAAAGDASNFPHMMTSQQSNYAGQDQNININAQPELNNFGLQEEQQCSSPSATVRISQAGNKPERKRAKERIYFMVPSVDAPRLIGTRGVNKKRIEEQTKCAITLHTESKKDGEFPVEINGVSVAVCENAKSYIERFLASNGSEERKERARPKVHLEFSPKKFQPNHDSPRKESGVDENGNC